MAATNKVNRPEQKTLIGIQVPGVYTRRFIEYLTDTQLTRLSFWLLNQREGANSSHRLNQVQQEVDRRGLQFPASWRNLPFDSEAQRLEWELWAARQLPKNPLPAGRQGTAVTKTKTKGTKKAATKKAATKKARG